VAAGVEVVAVGADVAEQPQVVPLQQLPVQQLPPLEHNKVVAVDVAAVAGVMPLQQPQPVEPQQLGRKPQLQRRMPTQVVEVEGAAALADGAAQLPSPGSRSSPGRRRSITTIRRTNPSTTRRVTACLPVVPGFTPLRIRWSFSNSRN